METKNIAIGRLTTKNNVFFAPIAGFSDYVMRSICLSLGASLAFTELVSAKGLKYNSAGTKELLKLANNEEMPSVQLFGSDPFIMREACESKDLEVFPIVDINMGCPVPKVFNNGEGSALMNNIPLAGKIVSECVKSGKIVTVKMRSGVLRGEKTAIELSKAVEDAGASMITVHGRSREAYYSGEVDYDLIATIKKNARVPIIANGGVFTVSDAENLLDKTGADGVMVARGALFNPFIFAQLTGNKNCDYDKKALIYRHIDLLLQTEDEKYAVPRMRKQLAYYLHGVVGARAIKPRLFSAQTFAEVKEILEELDFRV